MLSVTIKPRSCRYAECRGDQYNTKDVTPSITTIMLITLSIQLIIESHYAECRIFLLIRLNCAECHYVECHYADCHYAECHYAECHYAECHHAECHDAECLYTECRGVL